MSCEEEYDKDSNTVGDEDDEDGEDGEDDDDDEESSESSEDETRRPLLTSFLSQAFSAPTSSNITENEPNSPFMVGSPNIRSSRAKFIVRFIRFCAIGIPGALSAWNGELGFRGNCNVYCKNGSVPLAATQILVVFTEMVYLTVPFPLVWLAPTA